MPDLAQTALSIARSFNPELANQAERELQKYSKDKDGLQKLIADKGGEAFVNSAVNFANNSPKIKALFSKFGVNPTALKNSVMRDMQDDPIDVSYREVKENPISSFQDRLSKLR